MQKLVSTGFLPVNSC